MKWPYKKSYKAEDILAVLYDPQMYDGWQVINSDEMVVEKSPWNHPLIYKNTTPPWKIDCRRAFSNASKLLDWNGAHALAVISRIYGVETEIQLPNKKTLSFDSLMQPVRMIIGGVREAKQSGNSEGLPVAAFLPLQMEASEPLDTLILDSWSRALSNRTVMIVSAPTRTEKEIDFPEFRHESFKFGPKNCDTWPACLGATPFVLVVAATDQNGKLLEKDRTG